MIIVLSTISTLAFPSTCLFSLSSLYVNITFFIWKKFSSFKAYLKNYLLWTGQSKVVVWEDLEFTSSHGNTKSTGNCGLIPAEKELKTS